MAKTTGRAAGERLAGAVTIKPRVEPVRQGGQFCPVMKELGWPIPLSEQDTLTTKTLRPIVGTLTYGAETCGWSPPQ